MLVYICMWHNSLFSWFIDLFAFAFPIMLLQSCINHFIILFLYFLMWTACLKQNTRNWNTKSLCFMLCWLCCKKQVKAVKSPNDVNWRPFDGFGVNVKPISSQYSISIPAENLKKAFSGGIKMVCWLGTKTISSTYSTLTPFSPMFHFYTPWKSQKIKDFLTFSRGI